MTIISSNIWHVKILTVGHLFPFSLLTTNYLDFWDWRWIDFVIYLIRHEMKRTILILFILIIWNFNMNLRCQIITALLKFIRHMTWKRGLGKLYKKYWRKEGQWKVAWEKWLKVQSLEGIGKKTKCIKRFFKKDQYIPSNSIIPLRRKGQLEVKGNEKTSKRTENRILKREHVKKRRNSPPV